MYEVIAAGQVADELPKSLAIKFLDYLKKNFKEVFDIDEAIGQEHKKEDEMMKGDTVNLDKKRSLADHELGIEKLEINQNNNKIKKAVTQKK